MGKETKGRTKEKGKGCLGKGKQGKGERRKGGEEGASVDLT